MSHQLGFIGLGKMGKGMVLQLLAQQIGVIAYNRTTSVTEEFVSANMTPGSNLLTGASDMKDFVAKLTAPRVIWLMVPDGAPVDDMIGALLTAGLTQGDTIIDGGNTFYKDTVRRAAELKEKGIIYIDCGTSGGLAGATTGACLMVGGDEAAVQSFSWLWDALSAKNGWNYFGPSGAGHFVKMVHNGIEYGFDQALGEGIEILSKGPYAIDLPKVVETWRHGSIISGYLTDLLARALAKDPKLDQFTGKIGGGQTGGWTLSAAREFGVAAPVIENSLAARQKSLGTPSMSSKVVSALRREYGGHDEAK